ncbi:hypothetical protein H9L01_03995 [Erysipelothrix inopinata]|uniref:Uncharacterized protein n=1 Tax=Erysipelothrix inopinata TaxID=225084 RepID=A0A7G9S0Z9_9FIRM|nr:DUF6138 family protein [Erysipelothrix inopinata]QNN61524.1 hypothetical protein H9L01_03995 [Erysipelothrix inopinata]
MDYNALAQEVIKEVEIRETFIRRYIEYKITGTEEATAIDGIDFVDGIVSTITFKWSKGVVNCEMNTDLINRIEYFEDGYESIQKTELEGTFGDISSKEYKEKVFPIIINAIQSKIDQESFKGIYASKLVLKLAINENGVKVNQTVKLISDVRNKKLQQSVDDYFESEEYKIFSFVEDRFSMAHALDVVLSNPNSNIEPEVILDFLEIIKATAINETGWHTWLYPIHFKEIYKEYSKKKDIDLKHLDILFKIAQDGMMFADEVKYKKVAMKLIENISKQGYQPAVDMIEEENSQKNDNIIEISTKNIEMTFNKKEHLIEIMFKSKGENSYKEGIQAIVDNIKNGFPGNYLISIVSKDGEATDKEWFEPSDTEEFWDKAAGYESLHDLIREYLELNMSGDEYYLDKSSDEAMSLGGYAVCSLVLEDPKHEDIFRKYIKMNDQEHSLKATEIVSAYISKYGITKDNVETVITGMIHVNNDEFYGDFEGLENEDILETFIQKIIDMEVEGWAVEEIIEKIWGINDEFEELIGASSGRYKSLLMKLKEMSEE